MRKDNCKYNGTDERGFYCGGHDIRAARIRQVTLSAGTGLISKWVSYFVLIQGY